MDAVEKAAAVIHRQRCQHYISPCTGPLEPDMARAREIIAAISTHESSDEGTCWCPAAEQAGRERDEARAVRDRLRDALVTIAAMRQEADDWGHPDFDWRMLARKQEKAARDVLDRETP